MMEVPNANNVIKNVNHAKVLLLIVPNALTLQEKPHPLVTVYQAISNKIQTLAEVNF